jgi:hypothetical protein
MEKEEQRFMMKFLWLKDWGPRRIYEELMSTLGDNSYQVFQIKIWFQKFSNGDLSCKDSPRSGRPLLTLGPQLEAFIPKYPFTSARRLRHSASYLLSLNSSNHYSITPGCLKLSKSMLSRRLRHLTCLQAIYTFWRGSVHFAQEYWHPVRLHKGLTPSCRTNENQTVVFHFKNGETMALTETSMEKTSNI